MEQTTARFSLKKFFSLRSIPEALKSFFPSYICFLAVGFYLILLIHTPSSVSDTSAYILCGIALALCGCMSANMLAARGLLSQRINMILSAVSYLTGAFLALVTILLLQHCGWMSSRLLLRTGILLAAGLLLELFFLSVLQKGSSMRHMFSVLLHAILFELILNVLSGGLIILYIAIQALLFPNAMMEGYLDGPILLFTVVYPLLLFPVLADREERDYPKFLYYFFSFGVMPIMAAFTGVFYVYLIRILVRGEWPSNEVAPLVLFGSAVGIILTVFFLHQREKKPAKWFLRIFPAAWLLPLGMYFTSVMIRVRAYGLTPERVLLILFGLWMVFLLAASFFSRKLDGGTVILSFLLTFAIAVLPPVNLPFGVSRADQTLRLNRALQEAGMGDWKDVRPAADVDPSLASAILSCTDYLTENTNAKIVAGDGTVYDGNNWQEVFGFPRSIADGSHYDEWSGYDSLYAPELGDNGTRIDTSGSRLLVCDLYFDKDSDSDFADGTASVYGTGLLDLSLDGRHYAIDLVPVMQDAAQRHDLGEDEWYVSDVSCDGQDFRILIMTLTCDRGTGMPDPQSMYFDVLVMDSGQ